MVTFLSDFGSLDPYAGIVHGVVLGIAAEARVVDLTHQIPPQSIAVGSLLLRSAVEYFPAGTVHLAVVDPGVGGDRAPILAVTERAVLVGPDNGLLAASAKALGLREVRRLANEEFFRKPISHTFHARDIFAPVAAHLAAGRTPEAFGPVLDSMQTLASSEPRDDGETIEGHVIHVDHFGNLVSDIPAAGLGEHPSVTIGASRFDGLAPSYAAVPAGELVALVGSWGTLEIACHGGNAAAVLGTGPGSVVIVRRDASNS